MNSVGIMYGRSGGVLRDTSIITSEGPSRPERPSIVISRKASREESSERSGIGKPIIVESGAEISQSICYSCQLRPFRLPIPTVSVIKYTFSTPIQKTSPL